MANEEKEAPRTEDPARDPIADSSLSGPMLVAAALLFFSLVWGLYDELIGERPWKDYQRQFIALYTEFLQQLGPSQAETEKAVRGSQEFQAIEEKLKAAEEAETPRVAEIDNELRQIRGVLSVIEMPFQDARARIAALTYELEHTGPDGKTGIRERIQAINDESYRLRLPVDGASGEQEEALTFADIERRFEDLKARESQLNMERARATQESRELQRQRDQYLADKIVGLSPQQIEGLVRRLETASIEIRQIHLETSGLVDRCESCHMGIREPIPLTAADMGGQQVFVSHPNRDLLQIHDPTSFGCSPCHNGNGLATSSVTDAHGRYKHWLWPLFAKENSQAGCVQCHFHDRVLEHAPVLNAGRDLYQERGCVGCHRHAEYDREMDALTNVEKEVQNLASTQRESYLEIEREIRRGDEADTNEAAQQHYARAENLRVSTSNMSARMVELEQQARYLMRDIKKVAPNLKDIRLKLRKEWLPVWLEDPQAFRPGTKMPAFRLTGEEIQAISAFIWQAGLEGPAPGQQPAGDATRGKELFETRGCLGCHSIGEGDARMGDDFAGNLTRLGEKANYNYIVRWVHNPRERTRPYCPHEKRDLGPEDYTKHGLPFEFGVENSTCPNDGHQLQVQNMTVMPSLRLSWEEARDIATYLTSLKHEDASYPGDVSYMDDPQLAETGRELMNRYGCASCHEIQGLETAPRIGTELTNEASKPLEQLDFGLLEHQAKQEGWYNHKSFFERKLTDPAVFDQGREKAPEDLLRMPKIHLTEQDVTAITTFLLGSLDSPYHGQFRNIPEQLRYVATDQQRDIQEGWWLIKKYNCMGCHNVRVGQHSVLSTVSRYQDPDWKEQLPPTLIQEGARVGPEWLARFLANPAMNERDTNRNGVRTYLEARMPTFNFSPNEIRVLVRFFEAMAGQQSPYIPRPMEPLSEVEREMARALFSSPGAPCLKCHLVGDPGRDRFATAPNFLIAKERLKPEWTTRWMIEPQAISPGTAMPSGLFRQEGGRWVFAGPTPSAMRDYTEDHVQLLVRYMFQLTPEEQRRLLQRMPATANAESPRPDAALRAALSP